MVSETRPFKQGNRCCFTLFHPNGFQPDFSQTNDVGYATWQLEFCPSTGTPHYQGVIFFVRTVRVKYVNETYLDSRASLTRCDRAEAAVSYCTREFNDDGTSKRAPLSDEITDAGPWEYGNRDFVCEAGSHKRKLAELPPDIPSLIGAVQNGDIPVDQFGHHQRFILARDMYGLQRTWQTKVLVLWGPSGTGKSTLAEHLWPKAYYAQKEHGTSRSQGKLWFDGYDRHDVVIIDDYHYTLSLTQFKELVSKNGHHVPCKGSKVPFVAKLLVILSNDSPEVWWPNQIGTEHYAAAQRRMRPPVGKVIHITADLVKYYLHEDGHWHRKWLPGVRQLTQQIADFVTYDNRETVTDNADEPVIIPSPVPVVRETTTLQFPPSSPIRTSTDSATTEELPVQTPPDEPLPQLSSSLRDPPGEESQDSLEYRESQESVNDIPLDRDRPSIQLDTSQHPVSNARSYNLRTKKLKFVHQILPRK